MVTFVIILVLIVLLLGYISYNLFRKVEQLERIVDSQEVYISRFSNTVDFAGKRLGEIDEKGTFQSDDEIGWFFESIKTLQNELNDFNLNGVRR
jgi:predicted PurR-regulated permease PerM